jgi:UDP-glucose 4-epimerase
VSEVVLVTGVLGLNGSWCARELLAQGHRVVGFDRLEDTTLVRDIAADIELVRGDLLDADSLERVLRERGVDVVVHMAAALAAACNADPATAVRVNGLGTAHVLAGAGRTGVRRVVYASSLSVYGAFDGAFGHPTYEPVDESYPRNPQGTQRIYGATKFLCEELGLHLSASGGPSFVALRFSHILTPTRTPRHSGSAAPQALLDAVAAGRPARWDHGGDQVFDLLYVKDLARSVVLACRATGEVAGAYNIGSGTGVTLYDLADAARKHVPDADIEVGPGLDFMDLGPIYPVYDIAKAGAALGYRPEYDLHRAVADYLHEAAAR